MSRKSSSSGEDLFPSRSGERTPLKCLSNEILLLSSPSSRLKSSGDAGKRAMGDVPLCDSESHVCTSPLTKPIQAYPSTTDGTLTGSGLGDVTFKSFLCAGGVVEIADSSTCTEGELSVSEAEAACTSEAEEGFLEQSCCDHIEHPYYNPDGTQPYSDGISAVNVPEVSSSIFSLGDVDDDEDSRACHADCSEEEHATLKSFVCFGTELELSDTTKPCEETVPVPVTDFRSSSQHDTSSVNGSDDGAQLGQTEHMDHPSCSSGTGRGPVFMTFSDTKRGSETVSYELSESTLKLLGCAGSEDEISADPELVENAVPLPHAVSSCRVDPSVLAGDNVLHSYDRVDHPNCTIKNNSSSISTSEACPCSSVEVGHMSLVRTEELVGAEEPSIVPPAAEDDEYDDEYDHQLLEKHPLLPQAQSGDCPPVVDSVSASRAPDCSEQANSHLDDHKVAADTDLPVYNGSLLTEASLEAATNETVKYEVQQLTGRSEDNKTSSVVHGTEGSACSRLAASAGSSVHEEVQECLDHLLQVCCTDGSPESSERHDSARGSAAVGQAFCLSTKQTAEDFPDVMKVLPECPSVASVLQLGILNTNVRKASLSLLNLPQSRFLADNFEGDKSLASQVNADPSNFWAEHMESPVPRPLFNSTRISCRSQPDSATKQKADLGKRLGASPHSGGVPLMPEGQLQQQLRQMAEFLLLASGQVCAAGAAPPAGSTARSLEAPPAKSHSVCVGTSPVHSLNTSGTSVRVEESSVVDSCTETDPLVWNLSPGSLGSLPKEELEQRLVSSLIMVEVLVQQLAVARSQGGACAGPAPSNLREKLVQTDHTELSQTTMHRDLYVEALSRIRELELDASSLQNLIQSMQDMKTSMASLSRDTNSALSDVKERWHDVQEDHHQLLSHYEHMKTLFEKSKEMQMRTVQKMKEVLQEREDMRTQMEEALTAKDAAFSVMNQLRTHSAAEISTLEKSVGSQQELLAALNRTYPEQVALNEACGETLVSASDVLSQTMEEHSSLMSDLHAVMSVLQKTAPVLVLLNEKTAAALREKEACCSARDQAVHEQQQIEEELKETCLNLRAAKQEIGDLNLQVTILTSEMSVLRQQLTGKEEEACQLERTVTELSATISSTLASYSFLEQALAAETTKLQQSWQDIRQANERADQMEASLQASEEREHKLRQALSQSEHQVAQLQTLSQSQGLQVQQLQESCAQLGGVQEMNEFLQMENELAREQVAEGERMLTTNLQALRNRNIAYEDLTGEVCKLQAENRSLSDELKSTRSAGDAARGELEEKLAQAVTEITLLHHSLRGLTNELHASLMDQKQDLKEEESGVLPSVQQRHPSTSFVSSIILASTAENDEDVRTNTSAASAPPETWSRPLFSEKSAFTCIAAQKAPDIGSASEEAQHRDVADLLSGLSNTVSELVGTVESVRWSKDAQLQELHSNIHRLQVEQQAASSHHEAEVMELKHQLERLQIQAERGHQALQQKALDEKTLTKLMIDVQEAQEILSKHKTDNNELRKEVVELRLALQQSRVEAHHLRDELRKCGSQSSNAARSMEEKIQLLKQMERMKVSLQEAEQARVKLLDRAKRHQIIHQSNIHKTEMELQILNDIINKVRETLLSLPEVTKSCEQLQQLMKYIG